MLAVQDFTRLGSRAFVCSVVYKVYSYYDFGKDIKNNDKNKIKYFFCFLGKWAAKKRGAIAHVPSILCIPPVFVIGTPKFQDRVLISIKS